MTVHPIDTEALRRDARRVISDPYGGALETWWASHALRALDALAAAEHRATRAEADLDALQAVHRDATSHARRIIAHPDRWIAQGLIDATSNMLSALTGAVTIRGGAVQWRNHAVKAEDRADRAEARIKAVRNVLDQYEQENADTPDRYPTPHGNGLGPTLVDASDISHALDG